MNDARRATQLGTHIGGEELLQELAPDTVVQFALGNFLAVAVDVKGQRFLVEPGIEDCHPLMLCQHQELGLWQEMRVHRIEQLRAILDGVSPVERNALSGLQGRVLKVFSVHPLDRIAVQGGDRYGVVHIFKILRDFALQCPCVIIWQHHMECG